MIRAKSQFYTVIMNRTQHCTEIIEGLKVRKFLSGTNTAGEGKTVLELYFNSIS